MATILILYGDDSTRDELATEVRCLGHDVLTAKVRARAGEALRNERVDVMIAEMGSRLRDLDVVAFATEISPKTCTILTSEDATATDYKTAVEHGASDVLNIPLAPGELDRSVQRALEHGDGFHGDLHGLDLGDILQVFHQARRTLVARVGTDGEIHMLDGEVIHASAPPLTGRAALKVLLASRGGAVNTRSAEICPRSINDALQPLLLDLTRELEEERVGTGPQDLRSALPVALEDAITDPVLARAKERDEEIIVLEPEDLTTDDDVTPAVASSEEGGLSELTGPPPPVAPVTLPQANFHGLPDAAPKRKQRAQPPRRATPTRTLAVSRPVRSATQSPLLWGVVAGVAAIAGSLAYVSLERGQSVELKRVPPKVSQPTVKRLDPLVRRVAPSPVRAQVAARKAVELPSEGQPAPSRRPARRKAFRRINWPTPSQGSAKLPEKAASRRPKVVRERTSPKHVSRAVVPRRPAIGLLE